MLKGMFIKPGLFCIILITMAMNTFTNKILVAVDFEEQSLTALEQSFSLARLFKAGILLLFVIEEGSGITRLISPDDYHKRVMEKAREKFDEIEQLARITSKNQEIPVSYQIQKGKPYEKIIQTACDNSAILIVMGKGGKKKRGFFGGNTLNVVRQAMCPVITVENEVREFRNILMPIDFTGKTKMQVQQAINFGKYFGALVNVISVAGKENKITRMMKHVQLNQVRKAMHRNQVDCHAEIIQQSQKHVAAEICKYAVDKNADLIIIITQVRKHFSRSFIGHNAQEIIYSSSIPVLSINPCAEFHPEVLTSFVDPLGLMKIKDKSAIK